MAYAALVSLVQTINQILNHDHNPVNEDLEVCQDKASSLEGRIREVADTAEDLINHLLCENYPSDRGSNVRLSEAEFERQLREVAEKVKSTSVDVRNHFTSNDFAIARRLSDPRPRASSASSSSSIDDVVVGFEEDRMQIFDRLGGGSSKLQVLPIVGMGGIGKTTLAKTVYKNPFIVEHFDVRGWGTVSQDYSVGGIVLHLLASMRGIKAERDVESNKIPEENEMHKYLWGRRHLIVMDDVWSKKAWDDVRKLFPDNENGSWIMLTTRLPDMAAYAADPRSSHHMVSLLSEDQSWRLFCYKLFGYEDCPPELEGVGRLIVQRCRGLPISIVVVAGLLSQIRLARGPWEAIVADGRQMELETLMSLSYKYLPHHLKSCFLYMGGFPEDYEIRVSELIKLWIAEGFIKCPDGRTKSLEEEAEECLEDLILLWSAAESLMAKSRVAASTIWCGTFA